ncbi:MAG: TA system VapC family ribonuclease toxin [bacterium]
MPGSYLLDVNVLVALFDQAHIHHVAAHAWFEKVGETGWNSCPITENGFLRILSHSGYPNSPTPIIDLAERLEELKKSAQNYEFWNDDYSSSRWIVEKRPQVRSTQSTDAYLLNLCHRKKGILATFDQRIKPALIGEATPSLLEYIPVL